MRSCHGCSETRPRRTGCSWLLGRGAPLSGPWSAWRCCSCSCSCTGSPMSAPVRRPKPSCAFELKRELFPSRVLTKASCQLRFNLPVCLPLSQLLPVEVVVTPLERLGLRCGSATNRCLPSGANVLSVVHHLTDNICELRHVASWNTSGLATFLQ